MSASPAAPASSSSTAGSAAAPAASPSAEQPKTRGGLPGLVTRGLSKSSQRGNDAESPSGERSPRAPSTSDERPASSRARSSSSVLARLASRSSVQTSKDEPASPSSSKIDRAALEKPRGKYKSGVNWNAPGLTLDHEEPFMQTSFVGSPTDEPEKELSAEEELRLAAEREQAEAEEMLLAGSTAAAKAHAQRVSQAEPFFHAHQRALEMNAHEQSLREAATATLGPRGPAASGPLGASPGRSPARGSRSVGRPTPSGVSHDALVAEEGQRILAAARLQAAGGVYQPPMLGPDSASPSSSPRLQGGTSAIAEADERSLSPDSGGSLEAPSGGDAKSSRSPSPNPSTKSKRKTFLGFGGGSSKAEKAAEKAERAAEKKNGSSSKPSSRRASRVDLSMTSASGSASNVDFADTMSIDSSMGSIGTNGTARRRRYKDTRGLDILATELAAEALLSQSMPSSSNGADAMMLPGSFTPEARRASMMSVLGQSTAMSTPSNASQASLSPLAAPLPPFANGGGYGSGSASSSRNNSPRLGANDLPRFHSTNSLSVPSSPFATQKAQVKGLPTDMLTGLGDGPYPSLPPRRLEDVGAATDPFGLPMDHGSTPYDVSNTYVNRTSVYHTPVQVSAQARSRNVSATSASTAPSSAKRAVLSMSMHNPETELQGLTKPPKSGKSTPFGSRAPSRTVTPKTSVSQLRSAASTAGAPATPTQAEHAKQSARLREASEKLQQSTQRRASPPAAPSSATPTAPPPVPVPGVPAPVKASPAVVSASTPSMPPPAQSASKQPSSAANASPAPSAQKPARPAARQSRLSFFGGKKSQAVSAAPPSPKPVTVKGPTKSSIVASTLKPTGDIVPPVLNKTPSRNTVESSAERGVSPYSESGSSAAPHLSAPAPVAAFRRSSTSPDVRPARAQEAAPPVPAVPAAKKQQSATLGHASALRADLPGSKSSTTLSNSKGARASSESTKSVSKFSRFLSRLSGKTSTSSSTSPPAAAKKAPASHVSSGASTPSNAAPSFATAQERTAPNSPVQTRTSLAGMPTKEERSSEDERVPVARAFLNPELSASGFGTRAAYSTASAAPPAGQQQQQRGPASLSERSRSASADRSGSLDELSPQASEGSQEHGSGGSASTRSATSAGTLATTPNASTGMVAGSKEVVVPIEEAHGAASIPVRADAA